MVMEEIKCPKCGSADRKAHYIVNKAKKRLILCKACSCIFDDSGNIVREKAEFYGTGMF